MSQPIGLSDRLRIERAVWTIDTLAGDLPGRRRRSIRHSLRADLWASAGEVGAAEAVRRLGPLRRLAAEYVVAEYGEDRPRPHYLKGVFWTILAELAWLALIVAQLVAFDAGLDRAGITDGTYEYRPLGALGPRYEVTYEDGGFGGFALDLTPALLPFAVLLVVAFVLGGRLWRALPPNRRRATV